MTNILCGQVLDSSTLASVAVDASTTSGLTAATNFSVNSFYGAKKGGICTIFTNCQRTTSTLTQTSGNITPDTLMCTVPSGYRPPIELNGIWGDGTSFGEAAFYPDGTIYLRTAVSDIIATRNLRFTMTFIDPQ